MKYLYLALLVLKLNLILTYAQSTCPVQQTASLNDPQRCKCGIKIDGHIYIYCARKQLKQLPKFTRSSILYDELILSGNLIDSIQANSFTGLKVKRLLLDDNPFEFIEPNSFVELANYLEELILSVNTELSPSLSQVRPRISTRLFQSLLNLKIIKINGLDLDTHETTGVLRQNTFNRTRKLEIIHLVDSGLNKIEPLALSGVESSLKELNLDNNQLTSTNEIFNELKRMKRLQILNLSRNRIRQLIRYQEDSQYMLSDLQLDLSFNGIATIDEYAFGITSFDSSSTGLVNSITKLNLNNNELNQFQLNFLTQLHALKELYLDYNKIDFLPDNLFINSRRLETLSLKGNFIQFLKSEYVFSGLHFNLKRLNLAANRIKSITKRVFMQTSKLKELNLEKNQFGVYFEHLIEASRNEYSNVNTDLVNTFEGVESELRHLNLENNFLKPEHLGALVNLLNLESLKIGHNNFRNLSLRALLADEENEKIPKLNKVFEFYRNLSYLDMQNSSLKQMPYFHGLNRTLATINLAQNNLCNVNGVNLKKFYFKLKSLNLNSNPLKCDCNIIKLRQWMDDLALSSLSNYSNLENPIKWKCLMPGVNRNKYLNELSLNDLSCDESSSDKCELDLDEFSLRQIYSVTTTSTRTTSTSTIISTKTSTKAKTDEIKIIESNPTTLLKPTIATLPKEANVGLYLLKNPEHILERQHILASTHSQSFFSSIELKQTLLGSFIGALSVIIIVLVLICLVKTTRQKLLGKDISLCTSDSEKDKSTSTNITNASASPYELGKLSLQTLCINSTGCSASSSSTSSACSTNGSQHTNTSCVCGMLNQANGGGDLINFTKMDPMRLTMLNCNRTSMHQNYLNTSNLLSQLQLQQNQLHYLASNLPYQSPTQSNSTSPVPYQLNDNSASNESNTYDKLHHQQQRSTSSLRPGLITNKSNFNTLFHPNNQQQLLSSTLSFHNQHMLNSAKLGEFINAAETTPFLIFTNPHHLNHLTTTLNNPPQEMKSSTLKTDSQHTYHEIGDVLLNMSNGNMKTFNRQTNVPGNAKSNEATNESKPGEMYI